MAQIHDMIIETIIMWTITILANSFFKIEVTTSSHNNYYSFNNHIMHLCHDILLPCNNVQLADCSYTLHSGWQQVDIWNVCNHNKPIYVYIGSYNKMHDIIVIYHGRCMFCMCSNREILLHEVKTAWRWIYCKNSTPGLQLNPIRHLCVVHEDC